MRKLLVSVALSALAACGALSGARGADMSFERALNADREPQNWLLHHKNYQGHRFSALKEINTGTVGNLRLAFTIGLGGLQSGGRYAQGNLEATPLVDNGMMYIPDGWGSVYAIDVSSGKKGEIKWKFDPGVDRAWAGDVACCGVNNRGVALWKDKVISIALDGRIFALNRATGEMVWERKTAEPALGETVTLAPLVIRDLAIIGSAGGEFGIRGWIDATDLNTGQQAWRTFTIPGVGEPGHETWKDGKDRWKHGGGSIWVTATYDRDTDTIYQGIGNAGPDYDAEYRPGDNKWAASVLAMDPKTGRPLDYDPNKDVQTYVAGTTATRANPTGFRCPHVTGGKNWEPGAYNPQLNLIYIPSTEGCSEINGAAQADFEDQGGTHKWRDRFTGGGSKNRTQPTGSVKALDPVTGETKAVARTDLPQWAGVLATGGNLVFNGLWEGALVAYDGKTLKELWRFDTGCGFRAPPISYAVNGKQYIAIAAGPHWTGTKPAALKYANTCSMVYVFTL